MTMPTPGDDTPEATGLRLIALRESLGFGERQQKAFAEHLGLTSTRYNNYETGRQRVPIEVGLVIASKTGVTLDWLYRGMIDLLPHHLVTRLGLRSAPSQVKRSA